nr:uncharacterized protein LOC129167294 [Nothobranchius furzeri]
MVPLPADDGDADWTGDGTAGLTGGGPKLVRRAGAAASSRLCPGTWGCGGARHLPHAVGQPQGSTQPVWCPRSRSDLAASPGPTSHLIPRGWRGSPRLKFGGAVCGEATAEEEKPAGGPRRETGAGTPRGVYCLIRLKADSCFSISSSRDRHARIDEAFCSHTSPFPEECCKANPWQDNRGRSAVLWYPVMYLVQDSLFILFLYKRDFLTGTNLSLILLHLFMHSQPLNPRLLSFPSTKKKRLLRIFSLIQSRGN